MKNIIIYRLGSLGDTVVALPAFHKIAECFADAGRIVLTNVPVSAKAAPLMGVLGGSALVDDVIPYPLNTRKLSVLLDLRRSIRATGADTLVYLTAARGLKACYRDLLFFRLCGIRHIIGAPSSRDLQTNRILADGTEEPECHRLVRCLAALGPINLDNPENWDLHLSDAELAAGDGAHSAFGDTPYIAINMGGKDPSKDWGVENWRALLGCIGQAYPGFGLLVVGAPGDAERVGIVCQVWPGPLANACGGLSPRESGAAIAKARVFIGHDSGPLHLAAAMGVRCVGLFGNFNRPKKWHPYGNHHRIIHNMEGTHAITREEVLSAVREILG